jgi:phosphate uptake regulator
MVGVRDQDEEARKIQFSGKSSYMIALPKRWVEEMGLRLGQQVMVARQDDASLVITGKGLAPPGSRSEVVAEVSHMDNAGTLARKVISLYLLGYNMIHVRAKEGRLTSTHREIVKQVVRRNLVGTEVIADSTAGLTIQVLLSFPELSVENALRRMFLIAASMHRDAMLALKRLDADAAQGVIRADDEVDRFDLYVIRELMRAIQNRRILKEIGIESPRDALGYRLITKSVERVADHACKVAQAVLTIKRPLDGAILSRLEELSDYALKVFEESSLALFKRDYGAADALVEKGMLMADMEKGLLMAIEKVRPVESSHSIRLIMEAIRRTAGYASDIAEVVLDLTAERVVDRAELKAA